MWTSNKCVIKSNHLDTNVLKARVLRTLLATTLQQWPKSLCTKDTRRLPKNCYLLGLLQVLILKVASTKTLQTQKPEATMRRLGRTEVSQLF